MANRYFQPPITYRKLKGRGVTKKNWDTANDAKTKGIVSSQGAFEKRLFLCTKQTGAWMSVWGTTVTGISSATTKVCNFNMLIKTLDPPKIQNKCNCCMQTLWLCHMLIFPNGGLDIARHNKICDNIIHLTKQDFDPNCVRRKTITHLVRRKSEMEVFH